MRKKEEGIAVLRTQRRRVYAIANLFLKRSYIVGQKFFTQRRHRGYNKEKNKAVKGKDDKAIRTFSELSSLLDGEWDNFRHKTSKFHGRLPDFHEKT